MVNYLHLAALVIIAKVALDYFSNRNGAYATKITADSLTMDGFSYKMRGLLNAENGAWQMGTDIENQIAGGRPYQGGTYMKYK